MKEGLTAFTDTYLTSAGLIIFFLFFIGTVVWVSIKENRIRYQQIEKLPLLDGENHE
jgi:cbb3-type cytochrome oxidase subunit 3